MDSDKPLEMKPIHPVPVAKTAGNTPYPKLIPHDDETDGRAQYDWETKYKSVSSQIWGETAFVSFVLISSLAAIFMLWNGEITDLITCSACKYYSFRKYGYFFFGGVLGGSLFGIKYLFHVVARGYWHQDRRLWRLLSPLLAGALSFAVGALIDAGFFGLTIIAKSGAAYLSVGFITGYFSDKALVKMTEIADVIFGSRNAEKSKQATNKPRL